MLKVTSLLIYKKFKFQYFWNEHKKTGLTELIKYRNFKKKFEKKIIFQTGCAT